jgi:trk system potassium uptake protein TrkA
MGCGRVGASLADALSRLGHEVAIIDREAAAFNRLSP